MTVTEFLQSISLFPILLTLGTYQFGLWCQKKLRHPLCNPLLIATVLSIAILALTGFDPQQYQAGNAGISWLLTPATVCLAVPLYQQLKVLKNHLPAILAGIIAGAVTALVSVLLLCRLFRLEDVVTVSLLPKSITTAIALPLTEQGGGITGLTTFAIVITGILGNLSGSALCRLLKITHPIAQGVGFGTAAHVIGTARAMEVDPLTGAVSSLSLAVAGIFTAVVFPLVCMLI